MTSTALDLNEDSLLFLDFDPEVFCEKAKDHDQGKLWYHKGPTKATHYVKGVCSHCKAELGVSPVCQSYASALQSDKKFYWIHRKCGNVNITQETVTLIGTI